MQGINCWAVFTATIAVFLLGGVWYSEKLFGGIWRRAAGIAEDKTKCGHSTVDFIVSFLYTLVAAFAFAYFLGTHQDWMHAIEFGLGVGVCFVATSLGTNYLFTNRNFKLFLIDGGYFVIQFVIYGLIIGLWK